MSGMKFGYLLKALLALVFSSASFGQSSNLAYQVANLSEDVALLSESIRTLRIEIDDLRRENQRLRQLVAESEGRVSSQTGSLVTVPQLNDALQRAVTQLEKRDEVLKSEIVLYVNKQIKDLASSLTKVVGGLPSAGEKPPPVFDKSNIPPEGVRYKVEPGDTISAIAEKYNSRVDWIINANEIVEPSALQIGRSLYIPQASE